MIKVYLDTNRLEDYSEKNLIISDKILSDKFYDFLNQVSSNAALYSAMTIVIPQVVIDEITQHINESYQFLTEEITKIKKVYKNFDDAQALSLIKTKDQIIDEFNREIQTLIDKYPFIAKETHKDSIKNIYFRAINKFSPFYMKNKGLDSGFKDSILWKTAIENKGVSKPIICSEDLDFIGCGIEIIRSYDGIIEYANKNYSSKKELINSFIAQDYIKERLIDEINECISTKLEYSTVNDIKVELLSYLEIDDPDFYDAEVVELKIEISNKTIHAEFIINMPVNDIDLYQILESGE